jgi:hypothetical protein
MACEDGARFLLPKGDCAMLPIVHSTAEELAQYLWHRITTVRTFMCVYDVVSHPKACVVSSSHTHTDNRPSASTASSRAASTRCRSSWRRRRSRRAPTRAASPPGRSRCVRCLCLHLHHPPPLASQPNTSKTYKMTAGRLGRLCCRGRRRRTTPALPREERELAVT